MRHLDLLRRLAQPNDSKIVLLVLDGVGDIRTAEQRQTALEAASLPHLDALAGRSALGRLVPVYPGVTPGSGPGHLGLFGYDPSDPEADIGRGILEAIGEGLPIGPGDVAARGNFATADRAGNLTDRRAGRIPTEECQRLCKVINLALSSAFNAAPIPGLSVQVAPGEGHRFVLHLQGKIDGLPLSAAIADTDPQQLDVPPLPVQASAPEGEATAAAIARIVEIAERAVSEEPRANRALLRGFSQLPHLPQIPELYKLRAGAFAGYPLYRGAAAASGMEIVPCGKKFSEILAVVREAWDRFDFFFLHVKQTDQGGEDGNLAAKIEVLEDVDAHLPELLALGANVVAVTGDHSTPAPMKAHSWHAVPLLLHSDICSFGFADDFSERACAHGEIGTIPSFQMMSLLLANAGRLAKFGA
ncbi:MAG TPA: 2,3-bisphosphoglycerate-independent phosphoglycerate mutase [Thermoanaerobaculia bacterium]|jgi:2,3-bisphosphoglycerate-independent phosphoglycerate mutase|nr:2,3-bisphosphoglycerate-independent phosphoglycerate mutase [Thermoanaerobaculia bacterium]